jgi:hypothetical protein
MHLAVEQMTRMITAGEGQARPSIGSYLLPRLRDILFIALFLGVVGLGPRLLNVDGDLGRHLTIGAYILENRVIPTTDIFSHTLAGAPLTPHEWLAEILFALAYRLGGLNGVVLLCALLLSFTFTLSFRQSYARGKLVLVALVWTILAAAAASLHWLARPHLFTLLIIPLWTGELERIRQGNAQHWWLLPLLMFLWANLHGAFIAGFVIWGMYLGGETWDRWSGRPVAAETGDPSLESPPAANRILPALLLAGATSFLATFFNPSGWHLWATSLGYIRNRYLVSHTAEYLPPNFHDPSTWPFLLMLLISLLLLGRKRGNLPAVSVLLLAGWTMMGLYSVRNVPIYALVAAPILAETTAEQIRGARLLAPFERLNQRLEAVEATLRGFLWPVLVVALVVLALFRGVSLDFGGTGNRFDPAVFPVGAVDWLGANPPPGEVFNYFPWGGYLLYRLWPEQRVFIDGQTDFYGESLTRQYEQVITLGDGWLQVLEQYQVRWVLMPPESDLVQALSVDPGWKMVYQDTTAAVLVHEP